MGLETRGKYGREYWYEAERINGRVVKTYIGGGSLPGFYDSIHQGRRIERLQEQYALQVDRGNWQGVESTLDAFLRSSYRLLVLSMEAEGYHRPKCHKWRKRRIISESNGGTMATKSIVGRQSGQYTEYLKQDKGLYNSAHALAMSQTFTEEDIPASECLRGDLINTALLSDDVALHAKALHLIRVKGFKTTGYLSNSLNAVVSRLSKDAPGASVMEAIYRAEYRAEWENFTGTKVGSEEAKRIPFAETILIERIIACRFTLTHAEQMRENQTKIPQAEFWERSIDRAQRRYLAAIKAYAEIKRLALPTFNVAMPGSMQVNMGEKQVNVSTIPAATYPGLPV